MTQGPPRGTATVVLGDVAGSSRLWLEHPDAMPAVARRLSTMLDELAVAHDGHLPREQGEGDNVVATFAVAADALAFAVALDRALAAEPWPDGMSVAMRIGLHTGDIEWDDEVGYLGHTFNRCARLRDLGRARMILLSQTTRDVVVDRLPAGARLEDLGVHQLRDMSRTERVHQLRHADGPEDFPPLKSVTTLPNNLPVPVTSLLGREREIAAVAELVGRHRLVTLTGAGGSGKTRLAQHVASELLHHAPDGAWWVDLTPLEDPGRVPVAVAEAVGIDDVVESGHADAVLAAGIGERRLLLVLDNCEHLVDHVAALLHLLLQRCPNLRVVATSREGLEVHGEHVVLVRPLAVPDGADQSLATLEAHPATALFLDRATTLARDTLDDDQRRAVAAICRRLDGIPLAIELAAARTRLLSLQEIEAGLDDRFRLLDAGRRRRRTVERQRTLEASIAWSFELLDDEEEAMLCRLAVFPSAFDLDGARDVGADGDGLAALELLTSLVEKSLVAVRPTGDGRRYRLLETIQHFARGRLRDRGDEEAARGRHLVATLARVRSLGDGEVVWGGAIGPAVPVDPALREDVRVADATALAQGRLAEAVDLHWALSTTHLVRGTYHEALPTLLRLLEGEDRLDDVRRGRLLALLVSFLATANQQRRAIEIGRRALAVARTLADDGTPHPLVTALASQAYALAFAGDDGASELARECLALAREERAAGNVSPLAVAASYCALALAFDGQNHEALEALTDGLEAADEGGLEHMAAFTAGYLVIVSQRLGRPLDELRALLDEARQRVPTDTPRLHAILAAMAGVWTGVASGDAAETTRWLEHGLAHAGPPGSGTHALVLGGSAVAVLHRGELDEAVRAAEQARARFARSDNRWFEAHAAMLGVTARVARGDEDADVAIADVRRLLPRGRWPLLTGWVDAAEARHLLATGDPDAALDRVRDIAVRTGRTGTTVLPHALPVAAAALAAAGRPREAARAVGALEAWTAATGWADLDPRRTRAAIDAAVAALGTAGCERDRAVGRRLSAEDVLAWLGDGRPSDDGRDRPRPVSGWAALTPAELEVARRVASGMTNREAGEALFVSENTVKTHLKAVYAKLGISNRAELATAAATHDDPDGGG